MTITETVDVVVVGSGPGGSISARELSKSGRSVVVLEEGFPRSPQEAPYSRSEAMNLYRSAGMSVTLGRTPLSFAEARCVGGGSEVNSGFYHRLPESVLCEWARILEDFGADQYERLAEEVEATLPVTDSASSENAASHRLGIGADALGWASSPVPRWIASTKTDESWRVDRRTMSKTYLADAIKYGADVRLGQRVVQVRSTGSGFLVRTRSRGDKSFSTYRARDVYVCAGGTGSPSLLRRMGIRERIGTTMRFHPMARMAAQFSCPVTEPGDGVPVRQVTQFLPDLTMGCSSSNAPQVALWVGGHEVARALRDIDCYGVYYALVSSDSLGSLRAVPWSPGSQIRYSVSERDLQKLGDGISRLAELLFAGGAQAVFLPDGRGTRATSPNEVYEHSADLRSVKKWLLSTIHVYGGVPSGRATRFPLDSWGRVKGRQGLYVNDVSMLPTAIGVNPQGPLMALALRNVRAHIDHDH